MVKRVFVQVHKSVMADIYVHREERLPRCSVTDFSLSWTALMSRVTSVRGSRTDGVVAGSRVDDVGMGSKTDDVKTGSRTGGVRTGSRTDDVRAGSSGRILPEILKWDISKTVW